MITGSYLQQRGIPPRQAAGMPGAQVKAALALAKSRESLRETIEGICEPFGTIRRITLYPVHTARGEAIVGIVDMNSVRAQQSAALSLGVQSFGESGLVMRVETPAFRMTSPAHWDLRLQLTPNLTVRDALGSGSRA